MAVRRVQLRRGTTEQNNAFRGVEGEITVDTETKSIRVHDGDNDGGFDLMRADMSNNSFADADLTIAAAMANRTLTIGVGGQNPTTVSIPGNLTVGGNVTQEDTLTVASKLITINANGNDAVLSNDSIGVIFERTKDGDPGAVQDSAFMIWRENGDYFVLGTASVDETTASDFTTEQDFAYSDLYLRTLYAQTSIDVSNNNITSVGQVQADSLRYANAGDKLALVLEAGLAQADAFSINDGAANYLTINTDTEAIVFGTATKTLNIQSQETTLGTNAANDITIKVAARTGDNDGSDLTIKAGDAADSDDNLGGNLILASGSGVEAAGTSSIQFQTKRPLVAGVSEAMRIHTDGNVGIGDNAPGTLLQLSGADAYLTLKNTTVENGDGGAETKIIFEDHGDNALGQIEVSHQGALDDEFGQMIFSTNNDGGLQTALTIDKDQKATFAGDVVVEGRDLVLGTATGGNVSITVPAQTVVDDDGHSLSIEAGSANGDGTSGSLTLKTYDATETLKTALTIDTNQDIILGQDGDTNVNISLPTDSDGAGASLTISSAIGNNAGTNDGDLILRSGATTVLTLDAAEKATFAGAVEITTSLDLTDGNISNVATLYLDDIQCADDVDVFSLTAKNDTQNAISIVDADTRSYLSVDARDTNGNVPNLILGQPTNLSSSLAVSGLANLNAGIEIDAAGNDTNEFTVAHTTGNVLTKGTITSHGNHTIGVVGNGDPNLSVVNNAGTTTFSVTGATGNTTIAGTAAITGITTLDDTLKVKIGPTEDQAIVFNSDRGNNNPSGEDYDVKVINVFKGTGTATEGTILWDDDQASFSVTSGKLNSLTQFSVGPIAAPNFTVAPTTGVIDVLGTAPVLTLKNSTLGDGDDADPILIKFQNDGGQEHGRITASQDGGTKNDGKIVFSTGNNAVGDPAGPAVQTVLTLDHDKNATFTGNITTQDISVSNGTINVGGNGASIVATNATTLTITEDTIVAAGNLQVNGDITGDANEAKAIFAASVAEASTITLGGGGTVITAGKLQVQGSSISGVTEGDLSITSDGSLNFHIDADNDAGDKLFSFKVNGAVGAGTEVAQIDESGNLQIDGDLTLGGSTIKSNDGTATIELDADGADTTINKVLSVVGAGDGTLSIDLGANDGNDSVVQVLGRSGGDNLAGNKLILKGGGSTGSGSGGSIEFHTAAAGAGGEQSQTARTPSLALAIASDKSATFEGTVTIKGDLDIQGTGTNTTIDTTNLSVADKVIELARNADQAVTDATLDTGIVFTRGSNVHPAVFFWDENDDKFVLATKDGASTSTTDFSNVEDGSGAVVEAQLDVGTLNADVVLLDSTDATSLVFKESDNTTFLTLDTTEGSERVLVSQKLEAPENSTIGDIQISNGQIITTANDNNLSFSDNNLSTSGNLTINTNKFAVAGGTGVITLSNGATIDNETTATDLIITETNVVLPSGSLILGAETDDGSTYTIAGRTTVVDGNNGDAHRAGGDLVLRGAVGSNAGVNDGSVYIDSGVGRVASFDRANLKTTLHGTAKIVNGLDLDDSAITNVTDIALDSISADDLNTITVNIKQAGGASAFVIKDNDAQAAIEHIAINATDAGDKTTIGSATFETKATTAVDLKGSVTINSGNADKDFRVGATDRANSLFVDGSQGNVGIGTNTPLTMLQVEGSNAYLTLKNSDPENGDEQAETKIIFEDHDANDLGQIEVNHQGGNDDAFGRMVFSTNNNGGLQTALTLDKDQKATFASDIVVEGGDITLSKANQNTASHSISLVQAAADQHGHSLTISAGRGQGAGFDGGDLVLSTGGADGAAVSAALTLDHLKKATFAGNVSILGTGASALDFTDANITIGNTVTQTITLGGAGSKVSTTGDLEVLGGDAVIQAAATATASLKFHADAGTNGGDNWRLLAGTNDTLTIGNDKAVKDTFAALLTLTGHGTATSTSADFAGTVALNGGGLTVKNAVATGHAVITLIADNGSQAVDTWTIDAADDSATITINNNSVPQLTMLGAATATDGLATFAGDVKLNGSDLSIVAPNAVDAVINIQSSLGTANGDSWQITGSDENTRTLTFSGQNTNDANYGNVLVLTAHNTLTSSLATFGGNVKVGGDNIQDSGGNTSITFDGDQTGITLTATDKVIVSNNLQVNGTEIDVDVAGALNIGATVGAFNLTLGAATSTIVSSGNLQVNGDITGDADEAKTIFAATTTEARLITLGGGGTVKTAGKLRVTGNHIEDSGNDTAIQFDGSQNTTIKGNLTLDGLLTGSSSSGHVSFKDRILALATNNASSSNPVGFYGLYRDGQDVEYYNGLLYAPDSTAGGASGSWKLFHTNQTIDDDQDISITITDAELGIFDINTVRGGSAKGNDNTAGANLTISGGLSTGNATGGTIVFKTGGTGGAGSSVNSATTALTIDADQKTTLNVAGAGLDITKSTATHTEGGNGSVVAETSSRAISLTYTFNDILADAATSETITVTTDKASLTSVVIGTSSLDATVEVFGVSATGFKFRFTNISGGNFDAASDGKFNFVIL